MKRSLSTAHRPNLGQLTLAIVLSLCMFLNGFFCAIIVIAYFEVLVGGREGGSPLLAFGLLSFGVTVGTMMFPVRQQTASDVTPVTVAQRSIVVLLWITYLLIALSLLKVLGIAELSWGHRPERYLCEALWILPVCVATGVALRRARAIRFSGYLMHARSAFLVCVLLGTAVGLWLVPTVGLGSIGLKGTLLLAFGAGLVIWKILRFLESSAVGA